MHIEEKYLERWRKLIEEKEQVGESSSWKNSEFLRLSEKISSKSGISISSDTLKRIFGKIGSSNTIYSPQKETKNALAKYLDFESWEAFTQFIAEKEKSALLSLVVLSSSTKLSMGIVRGILILTALISIVSLTYFLIPRTQQILSAKNLQGKSPLTSIFYLKERVRDVSDLKLEAHAEFPISIPVTKGQDIITYPFVEPGYYKVKLTQNGKISSRLTVNVFTKGWEGRICSEHHFMPGKIIRNGMLHIDRTEVKKSGLENFPFYWTKFYNIKDFGVSGDSMIFETTIKNNSEIGGIPGFDAIIALQCESSTIYLHFSKGTWYYSTQFLSDKKLDGKKCLLPQFRQDFSEWRKVKVLTKDGNISIHLDSTIIYTTRYRQKLNQLKGISYSFKGSGAVKDILIFKNDGTTIYEDVFDNKTPKSTFHVKAKE